jgi:hypothetical protein
MFTGCLPWLLRVLKLHSFQYSHEAAEVFLAPGSVSALRKLENLGGDLIQDKSVKQGACKAVARSQEFNSFYCQGNWFHQQTNLAMPFMFYFS